MDSHGCRLSWKVPRHRDVMLTSSSHSDEIWIVGFEPGRIEWHHKSHVAFKPIESTSLHFPAWLSGQSQTTPTTSSECIIFGVFCSFPSFWLEKVIDLARMPHSWLGHICILWCRSDRSRWIFMFFCRPLYCSPSSPPSSTSSLRSSFIANLMNHCELFDSSTVLTTYRPRRWGARVQCRQRSRSTW
jgi:hypothetical protein